MKAKGNDQSQAFGTYGARHRKKETLKPVGDRDHEVLGMRSFGEYTQQTIRELSRPTTSCKG
jgi:hypothetical protein